MKIRKATTGDAAAVTDLACLLWPEHTPEELTDEVSGLLTGENSAVFLAEEGSAALGFAQCQLRRDYVEGTSGSPVGYLEGIFVKEEYRRRGIAGQLLLSCENWARQLGCREFASDCELNNVESFCFHLALGFREANRIICFTKAIGESI